MAIELLSRAREGDEEAFANLVAPYRRELHVHCYRTLGSLQEAEDALQETLLAAWRGLAGFESRASLRTWLYRIATNHCLNLMRSAGRRPRSHEPRPDYLLPEATPSTEPMWPEPYPDLLLDELPDGAPGPEARYEQPEAISLAFVTALQLLPAPPAGGAHPPRRSWLPRERSRGDPRIDRGVGDERAEASSRGDRSGA